MWFACGQGVLVAVFASACASAPAPAPVVAAAAEPHEEHHAEEEITPDEAAHLAMTERTRAPSTATYEEATSTPELLDVNDERAHLTDSQLTGPMRSVLTTCRVPSNARVTIKTAVQNGRAIGVSVHVDFEHPKTMRRIPSSTLRAESKMSSKIVTCADHAVRAVVWPPSRRRDSFTTHF